MQPLCSITLLFHDVCVRYPRRFLSLIMLIVYQMDVFPCVRFAFSTLKRQHNYMGIQMVYG